MSRFFSVILFLGMGFLATPSFAASHCTSAVAFLIELMTLHNGEQRTKITQSEVQALSSLPTITVQETKDAAGEITFFRRGGFHEMSKVNVRSSESPFAAALKPETKGALRLLFRNLFSAVRADPLLHAIHVRAKAIGVKATKLINREFPGLVAEIKAVVIGDGDGKVGGDLQELVDTDVFKNVKAYANVEREKAYVPLIAILNTIHSQPFEDSTVYRELAVGDINNGNILFSIVDGVARFKFLDVGPAQFEKNSTDQMSYSPRNDRISFYILFLTENYYERHKEDEDQPPWLDTVDLRALFAEYGSFQTWAAAIADDVPVGDAPQIRFRPMIEPGTTDISPYKFYEADIRNRVPGTQARMARLAKALNRGADLAPKGSVAEKSLRDIALGLAAYRPGVNDRETLDDLERLESFATVNSIDWVTVHYQPR